MAKSDKFLGFVKRHHARSMIRVVLFVDFIASIGGVFGAVSVFAYFFYSSSFFIAFLVPFPAVLAGYSSWIGARKSKAKLFTFGLILNVIAACVCMAISGVGINRVKYANAYFKKCIQDQNHRDSLSTNPHHELLFDLQNIDCGDAEESDFFLRVYNRRWIIKITGLVYMISSIIPCSIAAFYSLSVVRLIKKNYSNWIHTPDVEKNRFFSSTEMNFHKKNIRFSSRV